MTTAVLPVVPSTLLTIKVILTKMREILTWLSGYFSEVHFVHYNTRYGSLGEAADKEDGLAVLGYFIDVRYEAHFNFQQLRRLFFNLKELSLNS